MIIAGEASGDHHGAKLVSALKQKDPGLFVVGIGGQAMRNAGMKVVVDVSELAVVGITEILTNLRSLLKAMVAARRLLKILNPELLILIDFPGFNLPVAATAKKLGIPVLYYISPQIWAWRSGRVKKIGRRVDHMAVILPFEKAFYDKHGIPVSFVGHPLMEGNIIQADERRLLPLTPENAVVGLFPGSREREITRLLPEMLKAAYLLEQRKPGLRFVLSVAPTIDRRLIDQLVNRFYPGDALDMSPGPVETIFDQCACIMAASGTVTLEAAIAGVPMVIVYRVSPLSYLLGRMLVRSIKHFGLVNLIAGREVVPELLQEQASAKQISEKVLTFLTDDTRRVGVTEELMKVRQTLGGAGASQQVAKIAVNLLGSDNTEEEGVMDGNPEVYQSRP